MNDFPRGSVSTPVLPDGGSEMARRIAEHPWAATALGPLEGWPPNLRTAVDIMLHTPGPVSILWGPERIQLYNDAYIPIAAERHPSCLGRPAAEMWGSAYGAFLQPIFDRVFAGAAAAVRDQQVQVPRPDGEGTDERYFTASFSPIRDETGRVAGIFHPVTETTDRVLAEQRMHQSEAQLRVVLESIGEAFALLDRDFRVLAFNEAALRMETAPLEEILGRTHWEVYPASKDSEVGRLYKRAVAEQQPVSLEHRYTWENGTTRWLDMRAYPVPEGLAVFWRDISARKDVEARLRDSEARQAFLLRLSDALRPLARPTDIQAEAIRMLGGHLGASRVHYAEVELNDEYAVVPEDYALTAPNRAGRYRLADFPTLIEDCRAGRNCVVSDLRVDSRLSSTEQARYAALPVVAIAIVPLVKDGRLTAILSVHHDAPHTWSSEEIAAIEGTAERTWAAIERARAEAALRESEGRQQFRAELGDALRGLSSPPEIMAAVAERIGPYLGVDQANFYLVEGDEFVVTHDWHTAASPGFVGRYPVANFGESLGERLRAGGFWRHNDTRTIEGSEFYAAAGIIAVLSFSLHREGRWAAGFHVHSAGPRRWTDEEAELVRETAERAWSEMERVRAEAKLRESEARLRLALQAGQLAEVTFHMDGSGVSHSSTFAELFGHPPEKRLTLSEIRSQYHPDDHDRVVAERADILNGGQGFYEIEKRIVRPDGAVRWLYGRGSVNRDAKGRALSVTAVYLDETERKHTEIALRESEERFRAIVETATNYAILTTDPEGRIQTWPKGAQEVFGWTAEEAIGQPIDMTFTPEDRAVGVPETERSIARMEGQAPSVHWHQRKDGSRVLIDGVTRPLLAEDGTVAGFVMVGQDVTERQAADAALRESETRFRLMADAAPQIVWVSDRHGRMEFLNRQFVDYTGVPGEPWTAADMAERFMHPDDGPLVVKAFEAAIATGLPFEIEHRIRSATGEYRWFLVRGQAYRDPWTDEVVRWFGASVDIHDRRLAEARLRELNETLEQRVAERTAERNLLARVVETTDAFIQVLDLDFRFLAINKASSDEFERIYGVRPKVGDSYPDLLAGRPEELAAVQSFWGRALAGEEFTFVEEFGDPDRVRPCYEVKFNTLRDEHGERIGAYQFVYDVTNRMRDQARLAQAEEQLRQSQKVEAMGQLTGGVAHDFNNLLTPIIASLDMLLRRGVGSERERRLMDGALQSAERAKVLVQRLLAFARRQPLQPGPVDVARLVAGMSELIMSTSGPRIDVRVDLPDDLPPAQADVNQLEMALLNLAVNARDAMPDAGVLTISAKRESVRGAHPAKLRPGHYVRLSVMDTGVGMDEATLARAVEPFFSTKGIGRGTGLGLSMVHGLTEQLGGGLAIVSRPGQGTTVEMWLPISAVALENESRRHEPTSATRALGTALLVDDEDLVRLSIADMLTDLGYQVVEASSAEEALRLLERGLAPDLVVTDHLMPGMTGFDLARELRASQPDLPVVIVSGYAGAEGIPPGFPRLTKPFRSADLAACLRTSTADGKK